MVLSQSLIGTMQNFVAIKKTTLKGTVLKLFNQYTKENEIPEAEYIRDLIREDLKKKYKLGDGLKRL